MLTLQKITLLGYLGSDAQYKESKKSGTPYVDLSVACGKQDNTTWYKCMIFNEKLMDTAAHYAKKGCKIYLEGTPNITEGKTLIFANYFILLSDNKEQNSQQNNQSQQSTHEFDDDVPF